MLQTQLYDRQPQRFCQAECNLIVPAAGLLSPLQDSSSASQRLPEKPSMLNSEPDYSVDISPAKDLIWSIRGRQQPNPPVVGRLTSPSLMTEWRSDTTPGTIRSNSHTEGCTHNVHMLFNAVIARLE
jgi:hypothetical protein